MFGKVKIGNKEVEMLATASTPIRYKGIFKKDVIAILTGKKTEALGDFCSELGFVMAKQAEKSDMARLSVEAYYEWLDQFDAMDVYNATDAIWDVFSGTQEADVDPK